MIATNDVYFEYSNARQWHFPDIRVDAGGSMLITGLSGSGKTTFMHILAGMLKPQSGRVIIDTTDIYTLTDKQRDRFRAQNIGVVFQTSHFIRALNASENLSLAMRLAGKPVVNSRIDELLEKLQLTDRRKSAVYKMSVGEQQRLSIARALINQPRILLADEPTSALDDHRCKEVISLIKNLSHEEDSALVVISHDARIASHFTQQNVLTV